MNDPLSPLTSPPPRYQLESDSSDEEGQGFYPSLGEPSRRPRPPVATSVISIEPRLTRSYAHVLFGVGQVARYAARVTGLSGGKAVFEVKDGDRVLGRGVEMGETLLISLDEELGTSENGHEVCMEILRRAEAKQWIVLATHIPALYIPSGDDRVSADQPGAIRFLGSSQIRSLGRDLALPLAPPNYVTGNAAALASLASHPASPSAVRTQVTVLSLPLPLSDLPRDRLPTVLGRLDVSMSLTEGGSAWMEADDEPYEVQGMGSGKANRAAHAADSEYNMYI